MHRYEWPDGNVLFIIHEMRHQLGNLREFFASSEQAVEALTRANQVIMGTVKRTSKDGSLVQVCRVRSLFEL
jgi:hypothetical protein